MLAGRTPVIYGDGAQSRDFTYVDNVVDANLRALDARGLKGQPINVATGRAVTLTPCSRTLSPHRHAAGAGERVQARAGDIRHSLADISRRAAARLSAPGRTSRRAWNGPWSGTGPSRS
jgi:UDP-glucose 4-epimerase